MASEIKNGWTLARKSGFVEAFNDQLFLNNCREEIVDENGEDEDSLITDFLEKNRGFVICIAEYSGLNEGFTNCYYNVDGKMIKISSIESFPAERIKIRLVHDEDYYMSVHSHPSLDNGFIRVEATLTKNLPYGESSLKYFILNYRKDGTFSFGNPESQILFEISCGIILKTIDCFLEIEDCGSYKTAYLKTRLLRKTVMIITDLPQDVESSSFIRKHGILKSRRMGTVLEFQNSPVIRKPDDIREDRENDSLSLKMGTNSLIEIFLNDKLIGSMVEMNNMVRNKNYRELEEDYIGTKCCCCRICGSYDSAEKLRWFGTFFIWITKLSVPITTIILGLSRAGLDNFSIQKASTISVILTGIASVCLIIGSLLIKYSDDAYKSYERRHLALGYPINELRPMTRIGSDKPDRKNNV